MSGLVSRQPVAVHGVQMGVFADRGERPGVLPLELDPQQVQHVDPGQDRVQAVGDTPRPAPAQRGETSVDGPQTITWAPSFLSPQMFDRAVRLWAMSPTRATVRPAIRPRRWRMVMMSSRPWVGCSCGPSPALITAQRRFWASRWGVPGVRCRTITSVDPHGLDVLGRVDERLALRQAAGGGGEIERVGPQPPGGQREAGPRARGVLEEQVARRSCPSAAGIFRCPAAMACLNTSALSRIRVISSAERSSRPNRCRLFQPPVPPSSARGSAIAIALPSQKG